MGLELYLVTADGCVACEGIKPLAREKGVKELNITKSDRSMKLAMAAGIRAVPDLIGLTKTKNGYEVCRVDPIQYFEEGKISKDQCALVPRKQVEAR